MENLEDKNLLLEAIFYDRYSTEDSFRSKLKGYVLQEIIYNDKLRKKYQSIRGENLKKKRKEFFLECWISDINFRNNVESFKIKEIKTEKVTDNIYIITNPAYPKHIKIGKTINPLARLNSYNTCSPYKDYKFELIIPTNKTKEIEEYFKNKYKSINEWYELTVTEATKEILELV